MSEQDKTVISRKGKRGPLPTGKGVGVLVRLQPDMLDWLDSERAKLDDQPSRPEMIRRVLSEHRNLTTQ
ncbi:hypothetical protein CUV01_15735 [Paracoccus tegillarcae]|uniref:Uncharacterized protein n=1 Tax=Paracoccus tegillarcae TaxID=1529068 RepID=A0A2K9EI50_9RHOB|nr:hypothetical protein CUV01_15735 [Paracoccus tegillarcae]